MRFDFGNEKMTVGYRRGERQMRSWGKKGRKYELIYGAGQI